MGYPEGISTTILQKKKYLRFLVDDKNVYKKICRITKCLREKKQNDKMSTTKAISEDKSQAQVYLGANLTWVQLLEAVALATASSN